MKLLITQRAAAVYPSRHAQALHPAPACRGGDMRRRRGACLTHEPCSYLPAHPSSPVEKEPVSNLIMIVSCINSYILTFRILECSQERGDCVKAWSQSLCCLLAASSCSLTPLLSSIVQFQWARKASSALNFSLQRHENRNNQCLLPCCHRFLLPSAKVHLFSPTSESQA